MVLQLRQHRLASHARCGVSELHKPQAITIILRYIEVLFRGAMLRRPVLRGPDPLTLNANL